MSEVDSDTATAAEAAAGAEKLSFLVMIQNAVAGVTDEDIAEHWPTKPVAEGEVVLGVASRELQVLNAVRFQKADFVNDLIGELRSMTGDDVTLGQLNKQKYDILRAKSDHERWSELFWQTVSLEFGYSDGLILRADGTVVVSAEEDDLGRVDTILAFAIDYSEAYLLICSLRQVDEGETGE